jgi:hypothetical protein
MTAPLQSVPAELPVTDLSEARRWAWLAHQHAVIERHGRTEMPAYWMAEAPGFNPSHDAVDWLRASSAIDAGDVGISPI